MALAIVATVLMSAPSSAEDRPDILGKVLDLDGKGLAGVTVVASVEPAAATLPEAPAGTVSVPEQVGSAVTNGGGVFHLTFSDPEAVQAATLSDQTVSVILSASTPAGQVFHRVRLQATANGRYVAYQADVEADTAPSYRAELRSEGRDMSQSRIDGVSMGVPNVTLIPLPSTAPGSKDPGKAARGSWDPDVWCRGTGGKWFFKKAAGTARNTSVEVGYKAINGSTAYGLCGDGAKYPYSVSRTRQT